MKRFLSISLIFAIVFSCLTFSSCKKEPTTNTPTQSFEEETTTNAESVPTTNPITEKEPVEYNLNDKFDKRLITFVDNEIGDTNYMISSLSFRYALALAAYGAEGETLEKLLDAAGFSSLTECKNWVERMNGFVDEFVASTIINEAYLEENEAEPHPFDLKINNSVWNVTDAPGIIKEEFIKKVKENLDADAYNVTREEILEKLNTWVNDNTNGMIPFLLSDVPDDLKTVLVNTLYLKTKWVEDFDTTSTKTDNFTTFSGEVTEKEFMHQQDIFYYYEDEETQILIMPMYGNIQSVFVIGNTDNLDEKIKKAEYKTVAVKLPKFEIETSLDHDELLDFLVKNGAEIATDENRADFSNMIEGASAYIGSIVQKTKIDLNEAGIEAAAATGIMVFANGALWSEPQDVYYFDADRPFSFFIYANLDSDEESLNNLELLFNGKVVS